jgi:hypothetical protein
MVVRQLVIRNAAFPSVRAGIGREGSRSMASCATCPCSPGFSACSPLCSALRTRTGLALENLPYASNWLTSTDLRRDRAFWIGLSQVWSRWADALVIVKPDTVVRWHRAGFRRHWCLSERQNASIISMRFHARISVMDFPALPVKEGKAPV